MICELYEAGALDMAAIAQGRNCRLVIGSPPYAYKGERYPGGRPWIADDWVPWMVQVIQCGLKAAPVVVFVVNDPYRAGRYIPAVPMLEAACYAAGIIAERPLTWSKNAPNNRLDWWSNGTERILAFKRAAAPVPTFNWQAIGTPPKHKAGGRWRQRDSRGERRLGGEYPQTTITRPNDTIRATVGGGQLGHKLAHLNTAPYPEKLIWPIVLALTNPGDLILDPFSGSGTTAAVALKNGRSAIGIDNDPTQIELAAERIRDATGIDPSTIFKAKSA